MNDRLANVQNYNDKYGCCSFPERTSFLIFSLYSLLSLFSTFLGVKKISLVILPLQFKHNFCIACSYLVTHRPNYLGFFGGGGVIFCIFEVLFFLRVCFPLLASSYLEAVQRIIDVSELNSAFIFRSKHSKDHIHFLFLFVCLTLKMKARSSVEIFVTLPISTA